MVAAHIGVVLHDFSTGGSERIAIRLCNAWTRMGRRVTIFCGTEAGALRALVSPGVTVCCCNPITARSPISRILLARRLRKSIDQLAPDVLFSPGNFHLVVFALLGRLRFTKRPVMTCKLSNPVRAGAAPQGLGRVGEWVMRIAAAPIDAFVAMSPALRAQALTLFVTHDIHHIDEPVLDDDIAFSGQPLGDHQTPVIIGIGRLAPQKNFALSLAAFARLDPKTGARLVILGEGPLRAELVAEAHRLEIADRVDFKGYVADVKPLLAQASAFLMTSHYEGYPAVLIEAMAAGVPIVTTDCSPAIYEIVSDGVLGQVVKHPDPAAIASALAAAIATPRADAQRIEAATARNRMGASATAYLDWFDGLVAKADESSDGQA